MNVIFCEEKNRSRPRVLQDNVDRIWESFEINLLQQFMTVLQKRMTYSVEMAEHEMLQDVVVLF
jgi:hypothetical protein